MSTIAEFFSTNPLGDAQTWMNRTEAKNALGSLLPDAESSWLSALFRFVTIAPLKYWDTETAEKALSVLEKDTARTYEALQHWRSDIDRGITSLLHTQYLEQDERPAATSTSTFLALSNRFHPQYLHYAEHIFGNLLAPYWATQKRGSVTGSFVLKSALSLLNSVGLESLLRGYNDRVRNAVAHGEVAFRGQLVEYGASHPAALSFSEVLGLYDTLVRTSNALAVGLILFLVRNAELSRNSHLPVSLISLFSIATVDRDDWKIEGVVEAKVLGNRTQLQIAVRTESRSRELALMECSRLTYHLVLNGVIGYDRFLFEIDVGRPAPALVVTIPKKMKELIDTQAEFQRIEEAFGETQLLWWTESKWRTRFRAWKHIARHQFRFVKARRSAQGTEPGFEIRDIEDVSGSGIGRLKVCAIVRNPDDSMDRTVLRSLARSITREVQKKRLNPYKGDLERRRLHFPVKPSYIWVSLFLRDGTLRWLKSGGWPAGNLLVVSEWMPRSSKREPIMIPHPEEVWQGLRLRYSIDAEAFASALESLRSFVQSLQADEEGNSG